MIYGFNRLRRHPGKRQSAANLFTECGEDFHFSPVVLMGLPVLHIDDSDDFVACDDGRREEGFEGVLRQFAEVLEPGIAICLARDGQQSAFAGYPSGETFVQLEPDAADLGFVVGVRRTQYKVVAVAKIDKAGIAFRKFDNQRNNALQDLLQTHIAYHEPADFLEEPQLLFDSLQPHFKLFCLRHGFIIVWA